MVTCVSVIGVGAMRLGIFGTPLHEVMIRLMRRKQFRVRAKRFFVMIFQPHYTLARIKKGHVAASFFDLFAYVHNGIDRHCNVLKGRYLPGFTNLDAIDKCARGTSDAHFLAEIKISLNLILVFVAVETIVE